MKLIRPIEELVEGVGEVLAIKSEQEIPQEFIDENRRAYDQSMDKPEGNWMHVARIPASVVNHWFREGFDIFQATATEIQDKLKQSGLEYFLTNKKRA